MLRWSDLKISTRLSISMGGLALLVLAVAGAAWVLVADMRHRQHEISDRTLPAIEIASQLEAQLLRFRSSQTQHVLQQDQAAKDQAKAELDRLMTSIQAALAAYAKLSPSKDEAGTSLSDIQRHWAGYLKLHAVAIEHSNRWATEEAMSQLNGDSSTVMSALLAALRQLSQNNYEVARTSSAVADHAANTARTVTAALGMLALVLAAVLTVSLTRSVSRPLRQALAAADRIALGDLSSPIQKTGNDEAGQLMDSLARMQDSLVHIVNDVRQHAQSVAAASMQIAQGNSTLSQRTETQAAVLQETTSTMGQLGTTVSHNTANARQAQALAVGASAVAQKGGDVVGQVIATMNGINGSSKRIADIVSTIDGIAFQTNILALNAAVEAARAGEQGRGFAVVASEVRQLAQRSAGAAKEIGSLIAASVAEVERGTTLVDQAGQTMGEVVRSVQQVAQIVTEISSASDEQNRGVDEIGKAVAAMDQAVQQNTALVEESAAAAESLEQESAALVRAVCTFRIDCPA